MIIHTKSVFTVFSQCSEEELERHQTALTRGILYGQTSLRVLLRDRVFSKTLSKLLRGLTCRVFFKCEQDIRDVHHNQHTIPTLLYLERHLISDHVHRRQNKRQKDGEK